MTCRGFVRRPTRCRARYRRRSNRGREIRRPRAVAAACRRHSPATSPRRGRARPQLRARVHPCSRGRQHIASAWRARVSGTFYGGPMLTFSTDPDVAEQQMNAIIFYLTAFGYIDGEFDLTEKTFVKIYIRQLVTARANAAMPNADKKTKAEVIDKFVAHFHEVFEQQDRQIRELFEEVVSDQEKVEQFVYAKLKLRCYEIFHSFDIDNQRELLASVDELIYADGSVHPSEAKFREELWALLGAEIPLAPSDIEVVATPVEIAPAAPRQPRVENHPFFSGFEQHYSADPVKIREQAEADLSLMERFVNELAR